MRKLFLFFFAVSLSSLPACAQPTSEPTGQTWLKVTLGTGYEKPVQIHIFADHYRAPWYGHYAITKGNVDKGTNPPKEHVKDMLSDGESTGWVNISEMIYPDEKGRQNGGARLVMYPAYTYWNHAATFDATIEFAPRPDDAASVKKFTINYAPSTINIVMPPNLDTAEHIARVRSDKEFGQEIGTAADAFQWPQIGKKPVSFPFFVSAKIDPSDMDKAVVDRELKTLGNFGFNGIGNDPFFDQYGYNHKFIGGVGWYMDGTYDTPDREKISKKADAEYQAQISAGIKPDDITFARVMDEPTGQKLEVISKDPASQEGFRQWIKSKNLTPQELLVNSWDDVKIVTDADKSTFPALYYYSQQYRTIALGNFIAIQKRELQQRWKSDFPVVVNFSDGAVYYGNFYGQGVDYFKLLHDTDQNAIWGEDWSNLAATYQHASYNVALMQAAARKKGQSIGHFLIAYAGRKGYDIRLKAVSEIARGVRIMESYTYGPMWAGHDRSSWQGNQNIWRDHAAVLREIGAVEDVLMPAKSPKAQVALLYSSASDIWNQDNQIYGFERMNTWLALTHAQIPVDIVHESEVADGMLDGYKICYLNDLNITRAAAQKLANWVEAGGTLVMTAGAGQFDEYNRPLDTLNQLVSYKRTPAKSLQTLRAAGKYLATLKVQDTVSVGDNSIAVVGAKSTFSEVKPNGTTAIRSTFSDGSPAEIRSQSGRGIVIDRGFLPAIEYMREALIAKNGVIDLQKKIADDNGIPGPEDVEPLQLNEKSYNPWRYPANVRNAIAAPVLDAKISMPLTCSVPLVDAVYLSSTKGIVIPLANYTLQPIKEMTLDIAVSKPVKEVRSVYQGVLKYEQLGNNKIRIRLPLDCTDFVTVQ